jgi:hypothetical protein
MIGAIVLAYVPLKKLKIGDFEAELVEEVDRLERKIQASEATTEVKRGAVDGELTTSKVDFRKQDTWKEFFTEYNRILTSSASNVEKVISVSVLVEKTLEVATRSLDIPQENLGRGARQQLKWLSNRGLVGDAEQAAYEELMHIRNKVVHGGVSPSDETTARILDLAGRLVRAFA